MRIGHSRVQPDGLAIARDRLARPSQGPEGFAQPVVGLGQIRLECDRRPAMRQRLVNPAELQQKLAEIAMRLGVISLERNRSAAMDDGQLELAEPSIRLGQGDVVCGLAGAKGHGLATELDGLRELALLPPQDPQKSEDIDLLRIALEYRLVTARGLWQFTGSMKSKRTGYLFVRRHAHPLD